MKINDNTIWILDNKNNYPPLWEVGALTLIEILIIGIIYLLYWIYIYYFKYLHYNSSCIIGLVSSLLFLYLYFYQYQAYHSIISTTNNDTWYSYNS